MKHPLAKLALLFASVLAPQLFAEEAGTSHHRPSTGVSLTGEPIDEPIVGYGPFVMHIEDEIPKAFADFRAGAMGQLQH